LNINNEYKFESGYLIEPESEFKGLTKQGIQNLEDSDFSEFFAKAVTHFDTVIISDIHLGSKISRAQILVDFLDNVSFDRLIINGDVFDSINMRRLNRYHWKVLSRLRLLTDSENHKEVIWIRGNHDGYSDLLSQLLGVKVLNEYTFFWNDQRVIVMHGDIFDTFTSRYKWLSDIADYFYRFTIYIDPIKMRLGHWLKRNSKMFIRNTQIVRNRAVAYAKHKKADMIICGHTHYAEDTIVDGVRYLNSGCWTDIPVHFIGFRGDQVQVLPYL